MRGFSRCSALASGVALAASLALLATPAVVRAQDDEPRLAELRAAVQHPWLTLGALFVTTVDAGLEGAPQSATVRAARLRLGGTLDGGWSYFLQTNFASGASLLDARIGFAPTDGVTLYAGRFKTPYSREFIAYLGDLDLITRARVIDALVPNRQVGVQATARIVDQLIFSWGGFTGGENAPRNESLVTVARLEAAGLDVAGGVLSLAGQAAAGRDAAIAGRAFPVTYQGDGLLFGADARFERGALLLSGEYHHADWDPVGAPDADAEGWFAQAGWTLLEDHQVLARWDRYRAPGASASDYVVAGYNFWPQSFAQLQLNWWAPLDGAEPHRLLGSLELRF